MPTAKTVEKAPEGEKSPRPAMINEIPKSRTDTKEETRLFGVDGQGRKAWFTKNEARAKGYFWAD